MAAPKDKDQPQPKSGRRSDPAQPPKSSPDLPAETPKVRNNMALAGLILAFLFPPLGLIFSRIALKKSLQLDGAGESLANTGRSLSITFLILWVGIVLVFISGFNGVAKERQRESRERDLNSISDAIKEYRSLENAAPQAWSDIEGLLGGGLEYYTNGVVNINPANSSGLPGYGPGVFPPGPQTPSRGNLPDFDHDTVVIWQQAKCGPPGPDLRPAGDLRPTGKVVAGDVDDVAILYKAKDHSPAVASVCRDV